VSKRKSVKQQQTCCWKYRWKGGANSRKLSAAHRKQVGSSKHY